MAPKPPVTKPPVTTPVAPSTSPVPVPPPAHQPGTSIYDV